jgi:hypothetical protein
MVSFLRFLGQQRKMPGFPTHVVGPPTIRGKPALRGSCKERCWAEAQRYGAVERIKIEQLLVRKAGVIGEKRARCSGCCPESAISCSYPVTSRNTTISGAVAAV